MVKDKGEKNKKEKYKIKHISNEFYMEQNNRRRRMKNHCFPTLLLLTLKFSDFVRIRTKRRKTVGRIRKVSRKIEQRFVHLGASVSFHIPNSDHVI